MRLFKGLGSCRVYHFSSLSLRKKAWNNGSKTFLLKWGISIKFFKKYYLRSDSHFNGLLAEPNKDFFYYLDKEVNTNHIVRARSHKLLQRFKTNKGYKYLWCTFSRDQIDFDYRNPEVLLMLSLIHI